MLKDKPIPKVKTYENIFLTSLDFAYNIEEDREFGEMRSLTMRLPYYQYDVYNEVQRDEFNKPILNYNIDAIKNEMIIDFNNNLYLIKKVSPLRTENGKKYIQISCEDKAIELSYKNIAYLDIKPPIYDPVLISAAIINVLTVKFELDSGKTQSGTNTTIKLRSDTTVTNIIGKKICIINGFGQGQDRRIIAYDSGTKVVTIDSNWDVNPNSTSIYRVHYSKWTLGDVGTEFLNDGVNDIYRGYRFEDINTSTALKEIAQKLNGFIKYNYEYSETYNEFINKVSLVSPNVYNNVEFRYKKNILSLKKTTDSMENIYTRIFPYGENNLTINEQGNIQRIDNGVAYLEHQLGQSYIENYQYYLGLGYGIDFCRDNFINDFEFNNTDYVNSNDLYNDAHDILEKTSQPKVTYEIKAVDLSILTGFGYENFEEGDTIKIRDTDLNIDIDAVIKKKKINWNNPQNSTFELTNFVENLGDYLYRVIRNNNKYTDLNKVFGKNTTYTIADRDTSKNWKYADYFIPSGSHEAEVYINKLLDDMEDGGKLLLLEGEYIISSNINIKHDNTILEGIYGKTEIIPAKDNILAINTIGNETTFLTNITIKNIRLINKELNGTYYKFTNGITINYTNQVLIESCIINNIYNNSIIAFGASELNINNIKFEDLVGYVSCGYADIIDLKNCNGAIIKDNTFSIQDNMRCINIEQNTSVGSTLQGDYYIKNNYIKIGESTWYGLYINQPENGDINVMVSNNSFISGGACAAHSYITARASGTVITNNSFDGGITGQLIDVMGGSCVVSNNQFKVRANSASSDKTFIKIRNDNVEILDNKFSNQSQNYNGVETYNIYNCILQSGVTIPPVVAGNSFKESGSTVYINGTATVTYPNIT